MRTRIWSFLLCLASAPPAFGDGVEITVLPKNPLVEAGRNEQRVNFELLLQNTTREPLELSSLEMSVLAPDGSLVAQRRLGQNGESIATVPSRQLAPGARVVVFNPFSAFEREVPLDRLRFELVFDAKDAPGKARAEVTVSPRPHAAKNRLRLPVRGRVFVHDGHDLLSHHRRLDVTGGMTTALGITTNFMRYAYDFCVVDEKGRMFRGDGERNEDWYGFGSPIHAPAAGTVVEAVGDVPDNTKGKPVPLDREAVMKNVKRIGGNYVVLDHGGGEFSYLAHMKQGSVTVRAGDRVAAGQKIGAMGMSGDAFLVHLHYQLQSDGHLGEGLPSAFDGLKLYRGKGWTPLKDGSIDSGDVVESAATP